MEKRIIATSRECQARLVPTGDPITIPSNTFVTLTQNLGGTYTVIMNGNMARVDSADADALGFEPQILEFEPPANGEVDMEQVKTALATVYDPEIPVNVVDLGLICDIRRVDGAVEVDVTFTSTACPAVTIIKEDIQRRLLAESDVATVHVEETWEVNWTSARISGCGREEMKRYGITL